MEIADIDQEKIVLRPANAAMVTIGIPTMNRLKYLRIAVESALAQDYKNFEVVISDNASNDGTATFLAAHQDSRLRFVHQAERIPMTENWNACLLAARGEYFILLSDDDVLESRAIRELVAGYNTPETESNPPGIVYCGGYVIDADGDLVREFKHSAPREKAQQLIPAFFAGKRDLWLCAILFRTADILPGFPTSFMISSDSAVWIDAAIRYGSVNFIAMNLVRYRVHLNTTNSTPIAVWHEELRQLRDLAIDRQTRHNGPNQEFDHALRKTIDHLNMSLVANRINQGHKDAKWKGIHQYLRSLPHFQGLRGLHVLSKGVALLCLSGKPTTFLKKVRSLKTFKI